MEKNRRLAVTRFTSNQSLSRATMSRLDALDDHLTANRVELIL